MSNFLQKIKEIFFPSGQKCLICKSELDGSSNKQICKECAKSLPFTVGKICQKCGQPIKTDANYCLRCKKKIPVYEFARAPFIYEGTMLKLIKDLKYDGKKYIAKTLSQYIFDDYKKNPFDVDLIIPVPLFEKHQKKRGFNQSELLCSVFKSNGFIVRTDVISRIKDTASQTNLLSKEREENVKGAFKILDKRSVKDKNILIIDDVYTTGSTANECAKILIKSKAKKVYVLTVAHTTLEGSFK